MYSIASLICSKENTPNGKIEEQGPSDPSYIYVVHDVLDLDENLSFTALSYVLEYQGAESEKRGTEGAAKIKPDCLKINAQNNIQVEGPFIKLSFYEVSVYINLTHLKDI